MTAAAKPHTIHEAMIGVLTDVGAISKDRNNAQQGFKFRGIDDAFNALHGVFAKHGVYCLPRVLERIAETRQTGNNKAMNVVHLHVEFTFHAADGSHVEADTWGEAQDSGDKATGKAHSMAMKTALLEAFAIPTEDTPDPDGAAQAAAPAAQQQTRGRQEARPAPGTATTTAMGIENGMPTTDAIDSLKSLVDARALVITCSEPYKALLKKAAEQRRGEGGFEALWKDADLSAWTVVLLDACARMIAGRGKAGG